MSILTTAYSGSESFKFELGKQKKYATKSLKLPKLSRNLVTFLNIPLSIALLIDVM